MRFSVPGGDGDHFFRANGHLCDAASDVVFQLPHILHPYLVTSGRTDDWIAGLHLAEAAAIHLGHTGAWAYTLTTLGLAYNTSGETERGRVCLEQALALHRRIGQRDGEANTLNYLGLIQRRLGLRHEAITNHRASIALYRDLVLCG